MSQVTQVTMGFEEEFFSDSDEKTQSLELIKFLTDQLPPCESVTADISASATDELVKDFDLAKGKGKGGYVLQPLFVTFTDNNGAIWKEDPFNGMAPIKIGRTAQASLLKGGVYFDDMFDPKPNHCN